MDFRHFLQSTNLFHYLLCFLPHSDLFIRSYFCIQISTSCEFRLDRENAISDSGNSTFMYT